MGRGLVLLGDDLGGTGQEIFKLVCLLGKVLNAKMITYSLALLLQTLLNNASKPRLTLTNLPACLANPVAGGSQAGSGHGLLFEVCGLLPNGFITNGPANFQCLAPKEVSFHSGGTFGPASVVDLAVQPAARIGVTAEATDATEQFWELVQDSLDDIQDMVGLGVRYVGLGIDGLPGLALDNLLNREQLDCLLFDKLDQQVPVFTLNAILCAVVQRIGRCKQGLEDFVAIAKYLDLLGGV